MAFIHDLMTELQYPTNSEGLCHGIAYIAERARRCGQYDQFKNRGNYLWRLKEGQLKKLIEELNEKIKKIGPDKKNLQLNDELTLRTKPC